MYSNRYSCQILNKLDISQHIFEKYLYIKLHRNSAHWGPICSMRSERQRETTKLIFAFAILRTRLKSGWNSNSLSQTQTRCQPDSLHTITGGSLLLAQSVGMKPNFQGSPWLSLMGLMKMNNYCGFNWLMICKSFVGLFLCYWALIYYSFISGDERNTDHLFP
jgi:hypothetical protein